MSPHLTLKLVGAVAAGAVALAAAAGCGSPTPASTPAAPTDPGIVLGATTANPPSTAPADPPAPSSAPTKPKTTTAASSWPAPADCVSYNPSTLTVQYSGGRYTVSDGSVVVLRLHGQTGDQVGEQAVALAKRFRKHCYVGRQNNREDRNSYIFDYWREATGTKTNLPDEEDACSNYDRGNLTVEDMGSGHGWRVKDHDHVLHVFDNQTDARNGKLVASKYHQICFIGNSDDDDQDVVNYFR